MRPENYCFLSTETTDHALSIYMPGENHRCENTAYFQVPGELGQYLTGARVCKEHLKAVLRQGDRVVRDLRKAGVQKGQDLLGLQDHYRKTSIWAEMS